MNYPFGRPVTARPPSAAERRELFVLGAYPSALHVKWKPPKGWTGRGIAAIPIDDEPTPFWDGDGEAKHIAKWATKAFKAEWGTVEPAGNGTTGRALDEHYLQPLGVDRDQTWITDCVDTYCISEAGRRAIDERFNPFAATHGLPQTALQAHRSDRTIVKEAVDHHLPRLRAELRQASPSLVMTLGNAAAQVFAGLLDLADPGALRPDGYGTVRPVIFAGKPIDWYPLVHPRARRQIERWRSAHELWYAARKGL